MISPFDYCVFCGATHNLIECSCGEVICKDCLPGSAHEQCDKEEENT